MRHLEDLMENLSRNEPGWLSSIRREAFERYLKTKLEMGIDSPTTKHYTDVKDDDLTAYHPLGFKAVEKGRPECEEGENCLIEWDTTMQSMLLDKKSRSNGVVLAPLGDERVFDEYGDMLRKRLFSFLDPFEDKFAMMNAALWSGGVFIYVPENVEVALPIHLLRGVKSPGHAEVTRNLVIAGKNSKVNIFEDLVGTDVDALRNDVFEVVAEDGAKVDFQSIQDIGPRMKRISRYRARVEKEASIRWFPAMFGSKWSISRVESTLAGAGASNETYGAFLGSGNQHIDFANNTFHLAPRTSNTIFTRGIMLGNSASVFRGNIEIHILAKHSNSQMKEETLLLSKDASANSIPSLSIRTNEVTAKHAASIYQIDDVQTYYMMSRGLTKEESDRLMIAGFFAPIIGKIALGKFRNRLEEKVIRGVHDGQT